MSYVIGADEVGLGPLAGDLVVCAVKVSVDTQPVLGVTDSKKLTAKRREQLREQILDAAGVYHSIRRASPEEIDRDGIRACHQRCFAEAILELLTDEVWVVRVDGNPMELPGVEHPVRFVVRGDGKHWEIGAASIIAKVERDAAMVAASETYAAYGWANNKGYGTPEHIAAIRQHGLTPLHRRSFCRKFEPDEGPDVFDLFGSGERSLP